MNTLSDLLPNAGEYLSLRQTLYALMLLGEDGKHLGLNGLHLVIQLLEVHHLAPVPMNLSLQ